MQYIGVARNAKELEEAILLAAIVFRSDNGNTTEEIIEIKLELMSPYKTLSENDVVVIIAANGEVCAACFLIDRNFYRGKIKLKGTYLSSICVSDSFRGKGLSHLLMNAAIKEVKKRKNDFAVLIARKAVDHFYNKFQFWGLSQYSKIEMQLPYIINDLKEFEFVAPSPNDFRELNDIYNDTYKALYGAAERNQDYWNYVLWKSENQKIQFRLVKIREVILGYIIFSGTEVFELALSKSISTLEVLSILFSNSNTARITIHVTEKHPLFTEIKNLDFTISIRECSYGGHMVRIIDFEKMAKCLEEEIKEKLNYHGFANHKTYYSNSKAISVKINNGEVKCSVNGETLGFEDTCLLMGAKYLSCQPELKVLHFESFNIPYYDQI